MLICSKYTWRGSSKWDELPGDKDFAPLQVRQWRTALMFNYLADALQNNTGGLRTKLTDAFRNQRGSALQNVESTLDELHQSGTHCLLPTFYEQCLLPLEGAAAKASAAAAVEALPVGATPAEGAAASAAAEEAYWEAQDATPACQRLLGQQGAATTAPGAC